MSEPERERWAMLKPDGSLGFLPRAAMLPHAYMPGLDPMRPWLSEPNGGAPWTMLHRHTFGTRWGKRLLKCDVVAESAPAFMDSYLMALLREVAPDLVEESELPWTRAEPIFVAGRWLYD